MTHVSAETLHELLDGTLDPERRRDAQAHFAECAACAAQLASTRRMMEETSRLVAALDGADAAADRGAARESDRDARRDAGYDAARGTPPAASFPPEPVVLIPLPPEEPRPPVRRPRRRRIRPGLVLAAAAVAAVGIAWGVSSAKRGTPALGDVSFAPRGRNARAATPDGGGSLATAGADTLSPAQLAMRIAADSFDVSDSDMSTKSAPPANAASKPAPDSGAAKPAARDTSAARSRVTTSAAQAPSRAAARPPTTKAPLPPDREAAARATQELDREIRRQRAAQATAQLDRSQQHPTSTAHPATSGAAAVSAAASPDTSDDDASDSGSARPDSAAAAPAPAAPRPPSLDEQLGLERRIGLDEAAKILGEPVHVIDGMHALAVGVVDGGSVPGADATRPVVRVGYISQSGALVMLDQQRVRTLVGRSREPGAGPAGPRLLVGDILIYLHGRAPAEELRDLADRVR